jgi:carbon storage regulator
MLVLSRKKNESVVIGEGVEVFVVDIRGDKVRLGFVAPESVPVNRREVHEAIERSKAKKLAEGG